MSSDYIGIEEARKRLGDLVTAAREGADVILTRNGKPAARIVAIKEPAMKYTVDDDLARQLTRGYKVVVETDKPSESARVTFLLRTDDGLSSTTVRERAVRAYCRGIDGDASNLRIMSIVQVLI